jgi:hypothetical protein
MRKSIMLALLIGGASILLAQPGSVVNFKDILLGPFPDTTRLSTWMEWVEQNIGGASTLVVDSARAAGSSQNLQGGATGAIPFQTAAGTTSFDASKLFWDNTNKRLGIGTTGPIAPLHLPVKVPTTYIGQIATGAKPWDNFTIQDRYVYLVANTPQTFEIYDVTRPDAPIRISSTALSDAGISAVSPILVRGRYAYFTGMISGAPRFIVYDVSNPTSPSLVGSAAAITACNVSAIQGKYIYTASVADIIEIFDVSNPSAPKSVGSYTFAGNIDDVNKLAVAGRYAYMARPITGKFDILDISNPAAITLTSEITISQNTGQSGIIVSGRYAYTAGSNLTIIDISNPAAPSIVSTTVLPGFSSHMAIRGRYIYLTETSGTRIFIYDISNPAAPSAQTSITGVPSSPRGIAIQGRYLYVAARNGNNLTIYDLGGIEAPALDAGSISAGDIASTGDLRVFGNIHSQGGLSGTSLYISNNSGLSGSLTVAGIVGIGTTTPTAVLHLKAGTDSANTAPLKFTAGTNLTTAEAGAMEFDGTNLYFTPSSTRQTVTLSSDSSLKRNIVYYGDALKKVLAMRPVHFRYKFGSDTTLHVGLIAQELVHVDSSLVDYGVDGEARGVKYLEVIPVLVRAIQEQDTRITALEKRNAFLGIFAGVLLVGLVVFIMRQH